MNFVEFGFTVTTLMLTFTTLPILLDRNSRIPRSTSIIAATALFTNTFLFWFGHDERLAAGVSAISFFLWVGILIFRSE